MSVDDDQNRTSEPCPSYALPLRENHNIENATKDHISEASEFSRETGQQARDANSPSAMSADPRYELEVKETCVGLFARERPRYRQRLVCKLFNVTYDLVFAWGYGSQKVSGGTRLGEEISFPTVEEAQLHDAPSDMLQPAYIAFLWVLTDQLVGSMSWYEDETQGTSQTVRGHRIHDTTTEGDQAVHMPSSRRFLHSSGLSAHSSNIILLGCNNFDVFFDFSSRLYSLDDSSARCLKDQRERSKDLAGTLSLNQLFEELSFNFTVSLLQNRLLTHSVNTTVTVMDEVNLYGCRPFGLFIPYAGANVFTLAAVICCCVVLLKHGSMPGIPFSDIAVATRNSEIIANLEDQTDLLMAVDDGNEMVFQRYHQGGLSNFPAGGGTRENPNQGGPRS